MFFPYFKGGTLISRGPNDAGERTSGDQKVPKAMREKTQMHAHRGSGREIEWNRNGEMN